MDCSPPGPSSPWDFPGKNTGVGCAFLFQGIFWATDWTRVSSIGRWILYHWATRESPYVSYLLLFYKPPQNLVAWNNSLLFLMIELASAGLASAHLSLHLVMIGLGINLKVMLSQKDIKHGSSVYRYAFRKIIGIRINDKLKGLRQGDVNQIKNYRS